MSHLLESMPLNDLRAADITQLKMYVEWFDEDNDLGHYWGNKKEFRDRHERIKKWVESLDEIARSEGTKLPWQVCRKQQEEL